jgi:retinol dehydrogenase-12
MAGGPVAIVTGANTGIGYQTSLALVRRGYIVVLACRSEERGAAAAAAINAAARSEKSALESGEAVFMLLDTARVASVKAFAAAFLRSRHGDRLHALVLNAGMSTVGAPADAGARTSPDGFSLTFASNFLGHFLLTQLLLPVMKTTATAGGRRGGGGGGPPVRIVCLSSVTHRLVSRRPDWGRAVAREASSSASYPLSKLAMAQFAFELQRRFAAEGLGDALSAVAVNPGAVASDIWRNFPAWYLAVARPLMACLFLPTTRGAATSIAAAADPALGGRPVGAGELLYLSPYRVPAWAGGGAVATAFDAMGPFAGARRARAAAWAYDAASAAALWDAAAAAVGGAGASA